MRSYLYDGFMPITSLRTWLTLSALIAPLAAAQTPPLRTLSSAAALSDARSARAAIELIHPGLDRYSPREDVNQAFDLLEQACATDISDRRFYALLSVALARVRCSHTKAEPWTAWTQGRRDSSTYFPVRLREEDGRMFVLRSADPAIAPGEEIIAIDGISAGVIMSTLLEAVPADGWTDSARRFALFASSDLDECEFDHYYPFFFGLRPVVAIHVRAPGVARSRVEHVTLVTASRRFEMLKEPVPSNNLDESITLSFPAEGVALLNIGTFVAYRKPLDPEDIYRPFFEQIAAKKSATLIIDLRGNGGGSDEAATDLLRYLAKEPFSPTGKQWVRTYRYGEFTDKLETWDRSVLTMPDEAFLPLENGYYEIRGSPQPRFDPIEPTFRGRVLALCGPANASGATLCLAAMRARFGVTLVGEPTGGSAEGPTAGVILFLPLPNSGIRVRIPAVRSITGLPEVSAAGGLTPDVLVACTIAAELAGRDPVLERAIELAR